MNEKDTEAVLVPILKAKDAEKSDDALKFSQSACNAANALSSLHYTKKDQDKG